MRKLAACAWTCWLGVALGALPSFTNAQSASWANAPVYGAVVVFQLPPSFQPGFEAEAAGRYILELVPSGQTVEDWEEMLTLTAVQGVTSGSGMDATEVVDWGLQELAHGYQNGCSAPIIFEIFNDPPPKGAEDGVLAHLGCPKVLRTGQSEQAMLWVAVGQDNLYTLQWAERGPAQDSLAFEPSQWFDRFDLLSRMALCVPLPAEQAPYPSCRE